MTDYDEIIRVSCRGSVVTIVLECTDARKAESLAERINGDLLDRSAVTLTLRKPGRGAVARKVVSVPLDCLRGRDD